MIKQHTADDARGKEQKGGTDKILSSMQQRKRCVGLLSLSAPGPWLSRKVSVLAFGVRIFPVFLSVVSWALAILFVEKKK